MVYKLTLTRKERAAIDWVGKRYSHGRDLYELIWSECQCNPDIDWDDDRDIEFIMTESIAYQIYWIGKDCDNRWDLFDDKLCEKMNKFCDSII